MSSPSILSHRVPVGPKIVSEERQAEALRLQRLLEANEAFSFIRVGDFEFALLEDGKDPVGEEQAWKIAGTEPRGSTGLDGRHREELIDAIRKADFVDFLDLNWPENFEPLLRYRVMAKATCSSYRASYILGTWVEHHFKEYCQGRRLLFCGAEAPILENLCKDPEFLNAAKAFFVPGEGTFFLRPREDGRNLANNLQGIREDIINCVRENRIDTVFLSLGAGAKILCVDLARELGIHAIDFGAFMRALCYSGSDGNRAARSTHSVFLFRVSFLTYMGAVEKAFPNLKHEEILAKAHAQLLLEIQKKEIGWTYDSWMIDKTAANIQFFIQSYGYYRKKQKKLSSCNLQCKKGNKNLHLFLKSHGIDSLFLVKKTILLKVNHLIQKNG